MELHLERRLAEGASSRHRHTTQWHQEPRSCLLDEQTIKNVWLLRRMSAMIALIQVRTHRRTQLVLERLFKTKTMLNSWPP